MKRAILNEQYLNGYIINENAPIGTIMQFAKNCPNGFVNCNGQSLSRTNYNRLFAIIGTTYGADDENTFKVPLITDKAELDIEYMTGKRDTDGKPIYYKAMSILAKAYNNWEFIDATDNMSIDKVIDATMYGTDSYDGGHTDCMCSAPARRYSNNRFAFIAINYAIIANRLVIEYTKTTDTADTFCYNQLAGSNFCIKATDYTQATEDILDDTKITTGNVLSAAKVVEMNSYSTNEIIVGKWIDGIHDVATKTYLANIGTIGNGWKDITSVLPEVNSDNMELVLDVFAKGIYNNTYIQQSRAFEYEFREDKKLYLQMVGGDVQNVDTLILTYVKK